MYQKFINSVTSKPINPFMVRPSWRFLCAHPAHFVALGFGAGLAPKGPGTFGTLMAWVLFPVLSKYLPDFAMGIYLLLGVIVGSVVADITGSALGKADHSSIVWDEMIAFWAILWLTPKTWIWQTVAFVLFRIFDIAKPWPISEADRRLKTGFGVMFDDLLAAAYSLMCIAVIVRVMGYVPN